MISLISSLFLLFGVLLFASSPSLVSASEVVVLTDNTFDELTAEGSWLLEFYAPWCGHCKALAPIYEQAAEALSGKLNLGKIDCTRETRLAERFEIKGYPTLKFKRDGEVRPYNGGRTLDTFIEFGEQMAGPPIVNVKKKGEIVKLEKRELVLFVYIGAKGSKSSNLYEKMAYKLQGLYKFLHVDTLSVDGDELKAIQEHLKLKDLEAKRQQAESEAIGDSEIDFTDDDAVVKLLTPGIEDHEFHGPWSIGDIRQFFDENKFPLVAQLEAHTFDDITQSNRLLAFLIADPRDTATEKYIRSLYPVAKKWREKVLFSQVDGRKYSKYVSQFGINTESGLPAYVVLIYPDYYYLPPQDKSVAAEDIDQFLKDIQSGKIQAVGVIPWYNPAKYFKMAEKFLGKLTETELIIAVLVIFLVFFGLLFWLCLSSDGDLEEEKKTDGKTGSGGSAGSDGSRADSDEPMNLRLRETKPVDSSEGESEEAIRQRKSKKAE